MDELQNGAVTRTYAYGLERTSEDQLIGGTWTASFSGYGGHGLTRFLTKMAGGVTDTCQYDAFGNLIDSTGTTPNNYLFAGEQFDPALGFYYMWARDYRPAPGRFWTTDPLTNQNPCRITWSPVAAMLGPSAGVVGAFCTGFAENPSTYASDNPVDRVDPLGLDAEEEYSTIVIKEEHFVVQHILPTGVPPAEVESEVAQAIRIIEQGGDTQGWFEGLAACAE
jgi:RHS repeat-associated protein